MKFDLSGIYAKLDRAVAHTDKLEDRLKAVVLDNPKELGLDLDQETGKFSVRVHHVHTLQPDCALILSEAIHQYRSALDHLVFELSGRPSPDLARRCRFPIYKSEAEFRHFNGARGISFLAATNQATVKRLQPYKRSREHPEHDALWLLDELWNIDKHRTLLFAIRRVHIKDIRIDYHGGVVLNFETRLGDAVPGAIVASGTFIRMGGPYPKLNVEADLSAKVAFSKGCGSAERFEIVPLLREFEDDIRGNVIPKLYRRRSQHPATSGPSDRPEVAVTAVEGIVP